MKISKFNHTCFAENSFIYFVSLDDSKVERVPQCDPPDSPLQGCLAFIEKALESEELDRALMPPPVESEASDFAREYQDHSEFLDHSPDRQYMSPFRSPILTSMSQLPDLAQNDQLTGQSFTNSPPVTPLSNLPSLPSSTGSSASPAMLSHLVQMSTASPTPTSALTLADPPVMSSSAPSPPVSLADFIRCIHYGGEPEPMRSPLVPGIFMMRAPDMATLKHGVLRILEHEADEMSRDRSGVPTHQWIEPIVIEQPLEMEPQDVRVGTLLQAAFWNFRW